jgi:hypothetical protein
MTTIHSARSPAVVAVVVALCVTACGGSSHSPAAASADRLAAVRSCLAKQAAPASIAAHIACRGVELRNCLEQHGVLPGDSFPTVASLVDNPKYAAVGLVCSVELSRVLAFEAPLSGATTLSKSELKTFRADFACGEATVGARRGTRPARDACSRSRPTRSATTGRP